MKNNYVILIMLFISLSVFGLVYFVLNSSQSTEEIKEPEIENKAHKQSPIDSKDIKSVETNSNDSVVANQINTNQTKEEPIKQQNAKDSSPSIVKEITPKIVTTTKPFRDMTEEELSQQLQIDNAPELLIEAVNGLSALNKISDKSIDQLKGFIGKKNDDVDAYIIKALSKKATERDDVLKDMLTILKTSSNKVTKRCAADAIGEFGNAKSYIAEIESAFNLEGDERIKLKLKSAIDRIKSAK